MAEDIISYFDQDTNATENPGEDQTLAETEVRQPFIIQEELDKEKRGAVYRAVKGYFKDKVNGTTVDGKIVLEFSKGKKNLRAAQDKWAERGRFLHFTLIKENRETNDVINDISRMLRIKNKTFSFAGTKDRRGVTTQRCSGHKVDANKMIRINKGIRNCILGDYEYKKEPLRLGELYGNRFQIVLRNVQGSTKEKIEDSLLVMKEKGYINYFGMQRFGTSAVGSHTIGLEIIRQNWKNVIDKILQRRIGDRQEMDMARAIWEETKDPKQALEALPYSGCVAEKCVLNHFVKNKKPNDFFGAFGSIPRNLRHMYVHAYQSYIWNITASERISLYGSAKPVVGDLVVCNYKATAIELPPSISGNTAQKKTPTKPRGSAPKENELFQEEDELLVNVEYITDRNIAEYTILDVVLPTFGYDVKYPKNKVYSSYKSELNKDGINIDKLSSFFRDFNVAGNYRYLLERPTDLTYEFNTCTSLDQDLQPSLSSTKRNLLKSDFGIIPRSKEGSLSHEEVQETTDSVASVVPPNSTENEDKRDTTHLALKVCFNLKKGCYATMALREIMHTETSARAHAAMSTK
ncbi:Pseudouridylate synthase-like protein [Zancudomyces culisetae]|uniref:Pseudouridylate synthase-like protein n=1 Tax=Zancudomyces culisetae TaxID=1213189 RepID=A0A1R1PT25_ZANCU|nr:Pseudouridylate synthase-like protein [Zancudomyces culisetae]|eukprot:OMH84042.1 Pseudouridylate synthase-like protein [Zancudomyces culisetae]